MKKLNLLGAISLFLVFSGFTCQNNLDTVVPEQDDSIPVCETKGKLLKNLKGNMAWSEAVNNWVLWIDVDNPDRLKSGIRYVECYDFPEELKHDGVEIICDLESKIYPNPGAIKLAAHAMELNTYKIINNHKQK